MSTPSKKIPITIAEREYSISTDVAFNTGNLMNIELMKINLSDNKFDILKFSFNPLFVKQATRIEAIATFVHLIPELKKDLTVKSMLDLSYEQMEIIEQAFVEQYLPWYEEWMSFLTKPKQEEVSQSTNDEKK